MHDDALLSSTAFFGGGPEARLPLLLFTLLSLEFESSFSVVCVMVDGEVSLSSLDFLEPLFGRGDVLVLFFEDLLSDSDSELLSGENILFFFNEFSNLGAGLVDDFATGFGVLAPNTDRGTFLPLASTLAAFLGLAEHLLLGGKGLGLATLGISSSLDEDGLSLDEGLLGFGSSFFLGSSTGLGGDFGIGISASAGGSEADESESELLEPDPELVVELPLLLVSDDDPELVSVLVFITCNKQYYCHSPVKH